MAKTKPAWTNDPYQLPWRKTLGTGRWPVRTLQERFDSKLLPGPGDCWGWSGAVDESNGYARFSIKTARGWRFAYAHRVAYEIYIAEIPPGLVIDHLCRNCACVNPWHMEPVTNGENVRRAWLVSQTWPPPNWAFTADWDGRCHRGHLITPETIVIRKNGKQECRTCVRARDRARNVNGGRREHYAAMYQKRKAAAAPR